MPELPEVETTRRGIEPLLLGKTIDTVVVRNASLRWPVPDCLAELLSGQSVQKVSRRAKYLLLGFERGTLIVHLGMTGHLRVIARHAARRKHDHVELHFADGTALCFNDSRRFGAMLWTADHPLQHPCLAGLGPEPFDDGFTAEHLYERANRRTVAVKQFLMDAKVVVGVGNIYAREVLFRAGIDPRRSAGKIDMATCGRLADAVRDVLGEALDAGGTTIRDFADASGKPGYFQQQLRVYGRADQPCVVCQGAISHFRQTQRSTYFCPNCQR
mgnify:CR=1 FL=1